MSALRKATYDFAVSPCGGLRLGVNGAEVLMRASGAVWLASQRALIVADLHFEKGSSYAARGQMLPPYDTRETLTRLEAEVAATDPAVLIFLGDSFHDGKAEARLAADDARRIAALATGRTLLWIVGNHDADGPKTLPGEIIDDGRDGVLVPPEDVDALSRALLAVVGDEERRRALGTAALETARRYDPAAVGKSWVTLIDELAPRIP